ncbi:hypothetical protein LU293_03335 [Moraxella nasovis]|uniref:hypothetical protein n=1 Tax=Moraxella nasovis TaxID=2904121 RepID=UPI001F6072BF|nr:hypothetical protein [Moraxella nasovis]UNU73945.1 hypothetical protein LU293_03335 [Moraxella nasovis]
MAHDASENSPVKELLTSLIGITLFLAMVVGIGVFAFLRPAGEHHSEPLQTAETAVETVAK